MANLRCYFVLNNIYFYLLGNWYTNLKTSLYREQNCKSFKEYNLECEEGFTMLHECGPMVFFRILD